MKKITFYILGLLIIGSVSSCNNESEPVKQKKELTKEDLVLRTQMEDAASIVAKMSIDKDIQKEVLQGVSKMFDKEEDILFADLLKPRDSKVFKRVNSPFAEKFYSLTSKSNARTTQVLGENLIVNDIHIYWPYSEEWDGKTQPTITFHPLDNDDENIGLFPKVDANGNITYEEVVVNEEYAQKKPVWIIAPNERVQFMRQEEKKSNKQNLAGKRTQTTTSIFVEGTKTTKQWDGLFDGGPDFMFLRGAAAVKASNNGVDGAIFQTSCPMSRYAVRKEIYEYQHLLWDSDWDEAKIKQVIGVYEWDRKGETTISGGVAYKYDDVTTWTASISQKVSTEEPVLEQNEYTREYFFNTQGVDLGYGFHWDLTVRKNHPQFFFVMSQINY